MDTQARKTKNRRCMILLWTVIALFVSGCGQKEVMPTEQPTTAPVCYTVQLRIGDTMTPISVREGGYVNVEVPCPKEMRITGWQDEGGNTVDPEKIAVIDDVTYTAMLYPNFENHAPYLFMDENGFIHPDNPLTGADLSCAMQALAPSDTVYTSLSLPEAEPEVTKDSLLKVLNGLFPAEKISVAMANVEEGPISRAAFAQLMNSLLNRFDNEKLVMQTGQMLPRDLDLKRTDTDDILEAVLSHELSAEGNEIMEAVMRMTWQPGFHLLNGWLYYADESGKLLRNGQHGTMRFDTYGCYTSGDEELDTLVAERLNEFVTEDPSADRMELLYRAFEYSRDSFRYVNKLRLEVGETGWEADAAKEMFTKGIGNCYHYAASFWALARGLGYDAQCISGLALAYEQNHGWTEIVIDGENYIFDPQMAMSEWIGERDNWGEDMFMVPMWDAYAWRYIWP